MLLFISMSITSLIDKEDTCIGLNVSEFEFYSP